MRGNRNVQVMGLRLSIIAVTCLVNAVALTGCTTTPPSGRVLSAAQPSTTAAPVPVVLKGEIGTASFVSPNGKTTGNVRITARDGGFFVGLTNFTITEPGTVGLTFSPWDPTTTCPVDQNAFDFGNLSAAPSQLDLPMGPWEGDPSLFKTLVVNRIQPPGSTPDMNGCVRTPLAFAPVAWTVPDTRPQLHVHDSGSATGAEGAATTSSGVSTSYLVARGDYLNGIAGRFGISIDDIAFLNPFHTTQLQPGQRLNLSKALRGAGSVPPPSSS